MKFRVPWIVAVAVLLSLPLHAAELQVFAAASLTNALNEIAPEYQKSTGDILRFNFAGSNVLVRQIQEGAPADLFFSADEAKMNDLEKAGLILDKSRINLLSNLLVIITGKQGEIKTPEDLLKVNRLALADPKGVPAGIYAKEYLEKLKLWDRLQEKIVPTENVRAALAAVDSGNAEAGIVYKTDAAIGKEIKIAYEVPTSEGPKISYPIAIVKASKNAEGAQRLIEYLRSEPAAAVFRKYGLILHSQSSSGGK